VPSKDAADYMNEIWRVLKVNGLFIVVTTMPPEIFEKIAITPLNSNGNDEMDSLSNWKRGHSTHELRTAAGGCVYYYSIRKLSSMCNLSRNDKVMSGILALLEEAKKLKEDSELVSKYYHFILHLGGLNAICYRVHMI